MKDVSIKNNPRHCKSPFHLIQEEVSYQWHTQKGLGTKLISKVQ